MKTAISLPDGLFVEVDACARRLEMSRSRLLAVAARDYLARHPQPEGATDAWNRALAKASAADRRTTQAVRQYGRKLVRQGGAW